MFMKGRYLLVSLSLFVSLIAMGQGRRSSESSTRQTSGVQKDAVTADSMAGQDTSKEKIEEITPDEVDNFCDVLTQLMKDASGNFERIKGKSIETVSNNTRYTSMGGIPGAITSCLIHSPAKWQYEGILFQGSSKDDLKTAFDKCKKSLDNCLIAKGYAMSLNKNGASKQDSYPEYSYAKTTDGSGASSAKDSKNSGPRATLDVDYTAGADIYVLTLNVWSN
jgi:hypothetical protein